MDWLLTDTNETVERDFDYMEVVEDYFNDQPLGDEYEEINWDEPF